MVTFDEIKIPWHGWKIVKEIGKGTFGTVYEIERQLFNTTEKAAMKVIPIPRDESEYDLMLLASAYDEGAVDQSINQELERVEREYSLMSRMRGISNIVSCDDFAYTERENGRGYIVFMRMELLKSLQSVIRERPKDKKLFTEDEVIKLGIDICRALTVCEKYDIIHRDIKPQNVLISGIGAYNLGDFGTARNLDHTTFATLAGTVSFMAPEMYQNKNSNRTVDIYSLGLVMYWLMNGYRMPFIVPGKAPTAEEKTAAGNRRMSGEPLPAPHYAGAELTSVILKACAYRCEDRYGSAEEMLSDLTRLVRGEAPAASRKSQKKETPFTLDSTLPLFGVGDDDEITDELPETSFSARKKESERKDQPNYATEGDDAPAVLAIRTKRGTVITREHLEDPAIVPDLVDSGLLDLEGCLTIDQCIGAILRKTMNSLTPLTPDIVEINTSKKQVESGGNSNYSQEIEGIEKLRKEAEEGDPDAQFDLGECYEKGDGVDQDLKKAVYWYRKAAEQGHSSAQFFLALCYYYGKGTEKNLSEAVYWYRKDAEQGSPIAQMNLADCYLEGKGIEKNYKEAAYWYRKAAEEDYSTAQNHLGDLYYYGNGVEQNYSKAAEWYRKAAEQGNSTAQANLGWLYDNGNGVEQDNSRAAEWYRKAAEQGNVNAQYNLGWSYRNGEGVEQDNSKAAEWHRKAAEQGHSKAQYHLGDLYYYGNGVEQDYSKAAEWYRKAAKQGNVSAQYDLGFLYRNGQGVEQDYSKAAEWYREAAEQGHAGAQNSIGDLYWRGEGVAKNHTIAAEWFLKSAEQGNVYAQYNLGLCYKNGNGVEKNHIIAAEWFRKAADQGDEDAKKQLEEIKAADIVDPIKQLNLGCRYYNGDGVDQSYSKAVNWFLRAAEQGNKEAQYNLGLCYKNGYGVEKSDAKAAEWYGKAAAQGDKDAQKELDALRARMGSGHDRASIQEKKALEKEYELGMQYYQGNGVIRDYRTAANWFRKAAEKGSVDAQFMLGLSHYYGRGVKQDYKIAVFWYDKAANQGHPRAQCNLGVCYRNGQGVPVNLEKAAELYLKAAKQGNAAAQNNIGVCYYNGTGVVKSYTTAAEWFRKAAEQGDADAQNNLGMCYQHWHGVEQSFSKAAEWYRRAAEQGHKGAIDNLAELKAIQEKNKQKGFWDKILG